MKCLEDGWPRKSSRTSHDKVSTPEETSSLKENGWKESYKLPCGWKAKEKQQDLKKIRCLLQKKLSVLRMAGRKTATYLVGGWLDKSTLITYRKCDYS